MDDFGFEKLVALKRIHRHLAKEKQYVDMFLDEAKIALKACKKTGLPVVASMVWYKVGAIDDPQGSSGLAHLLEHLMFKSFDAEADETFAQTMSRLGAIDNALTAHDYTYFFQRVAKEHLPKVMAIAKS